MVINIDLHSTIYLISLLYVWPMKSQNIPHDEMVVKAIRSLIFFFGREMCVVCEDNSHKDVVS